MDEAFAQDCLRAILDALQAEAKRRKTPLGALSCTFLAAIIRQGKTLLIHVGDGGIVLGRAGKALELVSAPQTAGEYANQTYFVTSANPRPHIQTLDHVPACIAVFSDGVEMLALNLREKTPHAPFFNPFFRKLATETERHEKTNQALANFLASPKVNERTDDDKTLALAVDRHRYQPPPSKQPVTNSAANPQVDDHTDDDKSTVPAVPKQPKQPAPPKDTVPSNQSTKQKNQKTDWLRILSILFLVTILFIVIYMWIDGLGDKLIEYLTIP
jgi:hypothetical protein